MTEKADLALQKQSRGGFCTFSGVLLLSCLLVLNACSMKNPFPTQEELNADPDAIDITESVSHIRDAKNPVPVDNRINPKNLFGESMRGDSERLDRLERAVQDMRNEFDAVRPSIKRLMAIEGDIQGLIVELKKLNTEPAYAAPAARPMPAPAPAQTKAAAPKPQAARAPEQTKSPPPVQGGKATVYDIRTGEHPGKTRIVLDVNTKTEFKIDIDNNEHIMVIELPSAGLSAAAAKSFGNSAFLSSYKAESSDTGTMLIFQLKKNAKVGSQEEMGGSGGSRRIVLDLVNG